MAIFRWLTSIILSSAFFFICNVYLSFNAGGNQVQVNVVSYEKKIVVITPTHKRAVRMAEITMLAQTLMHVASRLFWVVVEDGDAEADAVRRLLDRSALAHVYLARRTPRARHKPGKKGWEQRDWALQWLRAHRTLFPTDSVVYFADDDNAYEVGVFRDYIPNVKKMGVWAVGTAGRNLVEAPLVRDGLLVGWLTAYHPRRRYAVDMAGFAVNMHILLDSNASFGARCRHDPEDCLLKQVGVPYADIQVFGANSTIKNVLAWHMRNAPTQITDCRTAEGYEAELALNDTTCF